MTPVTAADLDRWEALAAAATPGPWERDITGHAAFVKQSGVDDQYFVLGGARRLDVDCEFIATSRTAVAALVAALREALETSARLNRRSQIAEAAIADLTREPVGGRKHRSVAAEVWERCEESHGLACRTTREARDEVERLRVRAAAVAAAIGEQCRFDRQGCWVHAADLTPDGRCALLADAQAITAAETTAAPGPHSGTPATVEAVSVAPGEDSSQCNSRAIGGPLGFRCERASGHDPEVGHLSHHPRRGDRLSWWDPKTLIAEGGE